MARTASSTRRDVQQEITDQIVEALEAGTVPWHKPWDGSVGMPLSGSTKKPYRGLNAFLLGLSAMKHGFTSPYWVTFNQVKKQGGRVDGQKSTQVVLWKPFEGVDKETGEKKTGMFAKSFTVFNLDQVTGGDWSHLPVVASPAERPEFERIAECEQAMKAYYAAPTAPSLSFGGDSAHYVPSTDHVQMPTFESFESAEAYYGTLFHESVHSTGAKSRLDRKDLLESHSFGDRSYSKEELTAELGAAFLAGHTGIAAATVGSSASYIAHWIAVLKGDKKLLTQAASQAQKAVDLILGDQDATADVEA